MKRVVVYLLGLSAVLLCSPVFAGLNVQDITISTQNYGFFDPAGGGNFHVPTVPTVTANISAGGWDYSISGTVTLEECGLVDDVSSGGIAAGNFAGGATLSIVGDLWLKSDPGTLLVDDGLVLEALMSIPDTETWLLHEASYLQLDGSVLFDPTGGYLTGSDLTIGSFSADFSYVFVSPSPNTFNQAYSGSISTLQITAVPEPVSVALLGLGGLLVRGIKRKS